MDDIQKFENIKKQLNSLSDKKIRVEERLKNEKTQLETLLTEIKSKGYDPKKLATIKQEKQEEVDKLIQELESGIQEAETKLNAIEV